MTTLPWTGKDAVISHHLDNPLRLLKDYPDLSSGQHDCALRLNEHPVIEFWARNIAYK